jgi:hypothetical protein
MKAISDYLSWPMTEDIDAVLTNLSWEKKFELSVALGQRALDEKNSFDMHRRQNEEAQVKIQSLNPIEGISTTPEKTNESPT